jgi:hypothetical protein
METDYSALETKIKEIVKICEAIPADYRTKCFEYLLENTVLQTEKIIEKKKEEPTAGEKISISIDVRAFLSQYGVDSDVIEKLFLMEKGEIRTRYKITTTKKSVAQIQVALLLALENTLMNPNRKFEFSSEEVRQRCIDFQCYDIANFSANFKNKKNLFKSLDDLEHIALSAEGKAELAETMNQIINEQG